MRLHLRRHLSLALALCAAVWLAPSARAQEGAREGPSGREVVIAHNIGWRFAIAPGLFIPVNGGDVGFAISGDVRHGYALGPVVLAPGLRLAGYFPSDLTVLAGFATARLTVPIGPVGPFIQGGLGPGWVSEPSEVGLAHLLGGGVLFHIGMRLALGAEVTYQGITGTHFKALFVGPSLLFGF